MATLHGIEQGVSMYSYTQEFVEQQAFGIDRILHDISEKGVQKVELVGAQTFQQYPTPRADEIDAVLKACDKYGTQVYSYGGYVDLGRITGYRYTQEDVLSDIRLDIMTAKVLGAPFLRTSSFGPELVPQVAELAEKYDMTIGFEVHAPHTPTDAQTLQLMEAIDKTGTKAFGLVPDLGMFIERPSQIGIDKYLGLGARRDLLDYVIENRHSGMTEEEMQAKVASMGGGEGEKIAITEWFGFLSFAPAELEGFKALVPYTRYVHGKFYHVTEELEEPTIPYAEVLQILLDGGFQGVLMSEYEGHAFALNDANEQIDRHLAMGAKVLGRM